MLRKIFNLVIEQVSLTLNNKGFEERRQLVRSRKNKAPRSPLLGGNEYHYISALPKEARYLSITIVAEWSAVSSVFAGITCRDEIVSDHSINKS